MLRIVASLILLVLTITALATGADASLSNLRQQVLGPRTIDISYTAARNRVASVVEGSTTRNHSYDMRGNTTRIEINGVNRDFTYDHSNQPTAVRGGKTIYNVFSKVTGGLIYRFDDATGTANDIRTDYVNVGGAALRLKKTGGGAPVPEYTHFDSQGSAVAATNAAGTSVLWRERYAPFGEELLNPPLNADNTAYTGHLKDDATGLNYMQARYYDPIIGRFLSTDPIGYQDQLNLYAYVANDPVNKVDPTGEFAQFAIKFVVDVAIEASIQYATTGSVDVGSAVTDAAVGLVNPAKTLERAATLAKVAGKVGDGAAAAGKKGADFVVDSKGTAVRNSAAGARADLEGAGFKGEKTTETAENGTMHTGLSGKDGPMDVRIMDGQASGGDKGPRAVTTRSGTNDLVRSDGSKFRNNESIDQRRAESHIRLED